MLLSSIMAFLLPMAIYCWVLSFINRRPKPTMVPGLWDCVGLLLAAGGILLMVVPIIINRFFLGYFLNSLEEETDVLLWWQLAWGFYFTLLLVGVLLMLWSRRNKTVIYNVDGQMFHHVLRDTLGHLGLESIRKGDCVIVWEKSQGLEMEAESGSQHPPPCAEIAVEVFPALCNVSLHWLSARANWRSAVENRMALDLEGARVFDNPAAAWFLGLTGLLFGLIFLTGSVWFLINYFPPRHW